jgi:hypothetical protein
MRNGAELSGVVGTWTRDALFVRSEERRATGSRRALQDSAPTAGVRTGMDCDAELRTLRVPVADKKPGAEAPG